MIKTSKTFLGDDFLLETDASIYLYEQHASKMPIIDFHNHLSPKDIAEDRKFRDLTEIWLEGDHYKWRGMRTNGVPEQYCTGNASPYEKFLKWAETVPFTMRNPLYHWTHLELKNYFGVNVLLDGSTAREIFDTCTAMLQQDDFSVQRLLLRNSVEVVCTTDDPIDSLEYHKQFAAQKAGFRMFPTFRPDKSFAVENPERYREYIGKLSAVSGVSIKTFDDLLQALQNRVNAFHELGCRASDHGLEHLYFSPDSEVKASALFVKLLSGKVLDQEEITTFKSAVLINVSRMYHAKGWVQQ
ncbi:MAG: glucuronate isomerase, partial [Marivirga sp.]|nr:glucuronate isomerase [Marivirga sp.]